MPEDPEPTVVHVVPHTHWDREWYEPFQTFRLRLLDLGDRVLDMLEADERFAFTLDGQTAAVEDYLALRPDAEARLRRFVAEGRLSVGPWHILLDEFLVSGENIVRNLERGWSTASALGAAMPVGYLPDMFGHVAQMPQILRRAGLEHAAVWRGVPAAVTSRAFRWEAPDGSAVRTEYLVGGYGNAAHLFEHDENLPARIRELHESVRDFLDGGPVLAMYGTDHAAPRSDLGDLVDRANAAQSEYAVRMCTLAEHIAAAERADDGLGHWRGEMRSGARANLLMGVTSNHVPVKAAAGRAERWLERYAEPLQALYGERWPEEALRLAWDKVVANSAHDSICACSSDETVDQVRVRFAEAEQIARGLAERAVSTLADRAPRGTHVAVNPSPVGRTGRVAVDAPVPEDWDDVAVELDDGRILPTQEVRHDPPLLLDTERRGDEVGEVFDLMHGRELFGRWLNGFAVDPDRRRVDLFVDVDPDPPWLDVAGVRADVELATGALPDTPWQVRIVGRARRLLEAQVDVPALGWRTVRPVRAAAEVPEPVTVEADRLDNGRVAVDVAGDGTLTITGGGVRLPGVGRLVDVGDAGDSYNHAPPRHDVVVDEPVSVSRSVGAAGPLRGELVVERTYAWPRALAGEVRAAGLVRVPVTTRVELRSGEPFVRLEVAFDNPCADHRLRLHVPLPAPVDHSAAQGQFAVVERALEAEGGHGETPLPTFPARGFVSVPGVTALLRHVTEYEVVEGGSENRRPRSGRQESGTELALTLLRATGMISRNTNANRAEPAGPQVPIPGAQCRGPQTFGCALLPHAGSWRDGGALDAMERYLHPFVVAAGTATDAGPTEGPGRPRLEVVGDGVSLTALRRRGVWLEARLVCQQPEPATVTLRGDHARAREADLLGRPGDPLPVTGGGLELALGPWEIRTVQLAP